jgi:hypothetical protein
MAQGSLEARVFALEQAVQHQVSVRHLEAVQAALSAQIVQLGAEMHVEFSALHVEMRAGDEETRDLIERRTANLATADEGIRQMVEQRTVELLAVMAAGDADTRGLIDQRTVELLAVIAAGDAETRGLVEQRTADLLAVIAAGDEETRRHARVLHEEVLARIDTINRG